MLVGGIVSASMTYWMKFKLCKSYITLVIALLGSISAGCGYLWPHTWPLESNPKFTLQKHFWKWRLCVFTILFNASQKGLNAFTEKLQVLLGFWDGSELEFSWPFMLHCIYTENFELAQTALKEKSTSRIENSLIKYSPPRHGVIRCLKFMSVFLQSQRN